MRISMFLLGLCVVALVVGWLHVMTEQPTFPAGSSYSSQMDGAQALYEWTLSLGQSPTRVRDLPLSAPPTVLFIIQPETPPSDRDFVDVAAHGGTLVLAGDSIATFVYARALGVTLEPATEQSLRTPDGSLVLQATSGLRLRAANATPLLVGPTGDMVVARIPYQAGNLIVAATPWLLSNAWLLDDDIARFVYRDLLRQGSEQATVAFDEVHHSFTPPDPSEVSLTQLLFSSAAGRAILYAGLLTYVFVGLSGRRFGPPLHAPPPAQTHRTMYEHVQMLASLYRRAGQRAAARDAFSIHYARAGAPPAVLASIQNAGTEAELIQAVAAADDAG